MKSRVAAVAILALLATGCATRGSVRQLQADLTALKAEIAALRKAEDERARDAARAAADLQVMQTQIRDLRAIVADTADAVSTLSRRLAQVEDGLRQVHDDLASRRASTPTPPPPPERPARDTGRSRAAESAYASALAMFQAREHGQAVLEFMDFVTKYPKHPLASNAQYWIGEAYYIQRDYRQALVEFQKVLGMAPDGKAADSLLKIGLCYANLREPGHAQQSWQRVISEHPNTEAATKAKTFLRARRTTTR